MTTDVAVGDLITVTVKITDPCANPDSIRATVTAANVFNIATYNIALYPNPNNGKFIVSGSFPFAADNTVEITNALGKIVFRQHLTGSNITFDLTGIAPPGIYFARITARASVSTFKLVLQ